MKYLITILTLVLLAGCVNESQGNTDTTSPKKDITVNETANGNAATVSEYNNQPENTVSENIIEAKEDKSINKNKENKVSDNNLYPKNLLGTWMLSNKDAGFTLLENGSIETINEENFSYKRWKKENNELILTVITKEEQSSTEKYTIKEVDDTKLVLMKDNKKIEYIKQK